MTNIFSENGKHLVFIYGSFILFFCSFSFAGDPASELTVEDNIVRLNLAIGCAKEEVLSLRKREPRFCTDGDVCEKIIVCDKYINRYELKIPRKKIKKRIEFLNEYVESEQKKLTELYETMKLEATDEKVFFTRLGKKVYSRPDFVKQIREPLAEGLRKYYGERMSRAFLYQFTYEEAEDAEEAEEAEHNLRRIFGIPDEDRGIVNLLKSLIYNKVKRKDGSVCLYKKEGKDEEAEEAEGELIRIMQDSDEHAKLQVIACFLSNHYLNFKILLSMYPGFMALIKEHATHDVQDKVFALMPSPYTFKVSMLWHWSYIITLRDFLLESGFLENDDCLFNEPAWLYCIASDSFLWAKQVNFFYMKNLKGTKVSDFYNFMDISLKYNRLVGDKDKLNGKYAEELRRLCPEKIKPGTEDFVGEVYEIDEKNKDNLSADEINKRKERNQLNAEYANTLRELYPDQVEPDVLYPQDYPSLQFAD